MSHINHRRDDASIRRRDGFTLVELTVSMAVLTVVSLLTLIVARSTTSAVAVASAKEQAQSAVRDAVGAMTAELQLASKTSNTALIPPLNALAVTGGTEVVFQVPADSTASTWSTPIRYRFITEDGGTGPGAGNARLDAGEDTDGDGVLTRRIVRIQDGVETVLGATNDISFAQFALTPAGDALTITLIATKCIQNHRRDIIQVTATSRVYLQN